MDEIDHDDFVQRVAVATMEVLHEPDDHATKPVERIAARAGFPVGAVRAQLSAWGFQGTFGSRLAFTTFHVEKVEAAALLRIRTSERRASNTVNIHGGTGVQASAGGDVIGDLTVTVTYAQVLAELERDVDKSALSAEKKNEAKSLLRKFAATVGQTVLKTGMDILVKQTLGGG